MLFVDSRYVWESKPDGALAISEDTWNEPLGRGTEIRLHIRDEAGEYLEEKNLKRTAQLMYQAALFMLNDPKEFASRIYNSVKSSLSISPDAIIEEEDDVEEVET
ncbi:PREDICTED: endoplasmin homolog [Populus euphratica]|uniref:Endoplasmin homolog n=1 Tax=Populus euphratica TaxID=75702 RepID=A0AAJ6USW1_POPEU|nr:PREDICTED: endoplasmin homolog [Populus euphratica]